MKPLGLWSGRLRTVFGRTRFGAELCYEAKIFGSESAVEWVMDAINLVGVAAYFSPSTIWGFVERRDGVAHLRQGNVGVRRRQIEAIFTSEGYEPWETTFGPEK